MSWTDFILVGVLLAGAINAFSSDWRTAALCLTYAVVYGVVLLSPTLITSDWYITCALGELAIIGLAWVLKSPASLTLMWLSAGALVFHICTYLTYIQGSDVFYVIYPFAIKMVEGSQLAALILFSPPIAAAIRDLLKGKRTWTLTRWHI